MNAIETMQEREAASLESAELTLSVIVPTMNRPADVEALFASLVRQTRIPDEVIVVDQSTNNLTKIAVLDARRSHSRKPMLVRYVEQAEKSLVKARNNGLSLAAGSVISFLDDDVVLSDDYFERVMARFEADPSVGALSGNTLVSKKPAGWKWALRRLLMRAFLLSGFDGKMTSSGFGYPVYEREIDRPIEVDFLPGCNMNFRRSAIEGERFDEWFTGYGFREDVDFTYRVSRRARMVMIPEATLRHNYSTANRIDERALKKMEIRNYRHIFEKYRKKGRGSEILFAYSVFGLTLIDFIEFLATWSPAKFRKFRAALGSSFGVFRGAL